MNSIFKKKRNINYLRSNLCHRIYTYYVTHGNVEIGRIIILYNSRLVYVYKLYIIFLKIKSDDILF